MNNRSQNYSNKRPFYNIYDKRCRDNSRTRNNNYQNRSRSYSQSLHRKNTHFSNTQIKTIEAVRQNIKDK